YRWDMDSVLRTARPCTLSRHSRIQTLLATNRLAQRSGADRPPPAGSRLELDSAEGAAHRCRKNSGCRADAVQGPSGSRTGTRPRTLRRLDYATVDAAACGTADRR